MKAGLLLICDRCSRRGAMKPGKAQPSDGDAAVLFVAAHGYTHDPNEVVLCASCVRTLESMSLRISGEHVRAGARRGAFT